MTYSWDFYEASARKLKSTNEIRPSNKREVAQNAATIAHAWRFFCFVSLSFKEVPLQFSEEKKDPTWKIKLLTAWSLA